MSHTLDGEDKETVTHSLEWRIDDIAELAAHVEGRDTKRERGDNGGMEMSPSDFLPDEKLSVDQLYRFDLGMSDTLVLIHGRDGWLMPLYRSHDRRRW